MGTLSRIAAGLWRVADWELSDAGLADWVEGCLDLGITTFDLAEVYAGHRCHSIFGAALTARPGLRERLTLVTKCGIRVPHELRPEVRRHHYDSSAAQVTSAVERALGELGTDRIDFLLLHRPDPLLDPAAVRDAFRELERAGKVLAFGVSNYTPRQVELLHAHVPLAVHQVEASVLCLDPFTDGTLDVGQRLGVRTMAWSPLAGGRLFADEGPRAARVRAALEALATAHGVPPEVVAYAFLLEHPAGIVPVTGSGRLERIAHAARALELDLGREEWFDVWTASTGEPLP